MSHWVRMLAALPMTACLTACVAEDDFDPDHVGIAEQEVCPVPGGCQPPQQPPPIPPPPPPTAAATGSFPIMLARTLVTQGIDAAISDYNKTHSGTLSWNGAKLDACKYDCFSPPSRAYAGKHYWVQIPFCYRVSHSCMTGNA